MDKYEQRELAKKRVERYRQQAVRKMSHLPDVKINHHAHVAPCPDGAFVEMTVWVSDKEINHE